MSSSDAKPTSAEPEAAGNLSKSFADRLTFPSDANKSSENGTSAQKFNWADEVETPVEEKKDASLPASSNGASNSEGQPSAPEESSVSMAQTDGANPWMGGSSLEEPEFDVNVKLADLQADPNNPLYSVKSFEDLNLYVYLLA